MKINQYKTIRHIRKEIAKNFMYQVECVGFILNDKKFTVSEDDIEISKVRTSYIEIFLLPKQQVTEFLPFNAIAENQEFINMLFDLVSDVGEQNNLADAMPDVVSRLREEHAAFNKLGARDKRN